MKRLAILGAGGHGRVVADIAECCGWDEVVFFDDAWSEKSTNGYWPVEGFSERLIGLFDRFSGVTVAIGDNQKRADKLEWLIKYNAPLVSLVHPSAIVSRYAELGEGVVVMPGVVVNVGAKIGAGTILNTSCTVDHDCEVGCCVHLSPGCRLAGGVKVGSQSWIGMGASIKQLVIIGEQVVVGAGATVLNNLVDGVKAVGTPAKVI
jgi:sugar O-acyltransferase (sialic acid O-acetyltransferase NeuD family)